MRGVCVVRGVRGGAGCAVVRGARWCGVRGGAWCEQVGRVRCVRWYSGAAGSMLRSARVASASCVLLVACCVVCVNCGCERGEVGVGCAWRAVRGGVRVDMSVWVVCSCG